MKEKLNNLLSTLKNNKKKVVGITLGVFFAFIFTFATYNINNPTYFNRLFANVLNNGTPANEAFEDNTFYSCIIDEYNNENSASKAYTDSLTDEELASITSLTCNHKSIESTKGIEKLTGLTSLELQDADLTSIDLSNNTALTSLNLRDNPFQIIYTMKIGDTYDIVDNITLPNESQPTYSIEDTSIAKIENNVITALKSGTTRLIIDTGYSDGNNNDSKIYLNIEVKNITTVFEDSNFNTCVVDTYNSANGTSKSYTEGLTDDELASISNLSCDGLTGKRIYNVNGIEKFINLKSLSLYYQYSLKSLDVSKLLKLESLSLGDCLLKELDVSKNAELKNLYLEGNQLTSLNIDNNIKLERLHLGFSNVSSNSIKELNLSNNINLKELDVSSNGMSYLDLSNNINLESLIINSSVNVNNNTLISDINAKEVMFIGNKTKLNSSNINIVPPSGMEFSYQSDNENIFDIKNNTITAKASGTANLLVKMGDITIDTKSIRVSNLEISGNYEVNNDAKYINIKDSYVLNDDGSINSDSLLNDIYVNSDVSLDKTIEDNKLKLTYNGELVSEYNIVGYKIVNYKFQKNYDYSTGGYKVYLGTNNFNIDNDILLLNGYAEEENDNLIIYDNDKKENIIDTIKLLKISSNYYDLKSAYSENDNSYYIYNKDDNLDLSKIKLSDGLIINDEGYRKVIADNDGYTYSYIYTTSIYTSNYSYYKLIDDCIYLGLVEKNNNPYISVNNGYAQKNENKFDIYTSAGQKVDSIDIISLEIDDSIHDAYEYEFRNSSIYFGTNVFNPLYITNKINCTYEYSTETATISVKHNDKLIDEIKIINVYFPENLNVFSDVDSFELVLSMKDINFDKKIIKNITNINEIDKNKINVMNGTMKYLIDEEDGEMLSIYPLSNSDDDELDDITSISIITMSSSNYSLSKDYIYLGTKDFENDIHVIAFGQDISPDLHDEDNFIEYTITDKMVEIWAVGETCDDDDNCKMEKLFKLGSWNLIKASSDKYDLSSDTITLGDDELLDLNSINIQNGIISIDGDTLVIKYNDEVVKKIKVKGGKKNTPNTTIENKTTNNSNVKTTVKATKTTTRRKSLFESLFGRKSSNKTTTKTTTTKYNSNTKTKTTTTVIVNKKNISTTKTKSSKTIKLDVKMLVILLVSFNIIFVSILYLLKKDKKENS